MLNMKTINEKAINRIRREAKQLGSQLKALQSEKRKSSKGVVVRKGEDKVLPHEQP